MALSKNVTNALARLRNIKRCNDCDMMLADANGRATWVDGIPQVSFLHLPTNTLRCQWCDAKFHEHPA